MDSLTFGSAIFPFPAGLKASPALCACVMLAGLVAGCASSGNQVDDNAREIPSAEQEPDVWEQQALDARNLHDEGNLREARERYETLLERAESPDDRRYIRLQLARLSADREEWDEALEGYEEIWSEEIEDRYGARAMFEASRVIERTSQGKDARPTETSQGKDAPPKGLPAAERLRWRLVARYPESTWAERSVESIAAHYAEGEEWASLQREFDRLHDELAPTSIADDILFEAAIVLGNRRGDRETALAYLRRLLDEHPDALLADDAEWEAARLCIDTQDWSCALPLLRRLSERTRGSVAAPKLGVLHPPYASKALYRLGYLHLTHLDDYAAAAEQFRRFLDEFPDHPKADDSAWHLAHAHRLAGEREAYRRALRRLIDDYPKSRHVEPARRQLGGQS